MLFNSYIFLFCFLPATVMLGGLFLVKERQIAYLGVLVAASVIFYGYSELSWLLLLATSVFGNYGLARAILAADRGRRTLTTLGVVFNLGLLGYFKYADFFIENLSAATGLDVSTLGVVLPIGISFYTFQQIAFLVDTWLFTSFSGHPFISLPFLVTVIPFD